MKDINPTVAILTQNVNKLKIQSKDMLKVVIKIFNYVT